LGYALTFGAVVRTDALNGAATAADDHFTLSVPHGFIAKPFGRLALVIILVFWGNGSGVPLAKPAYSWRIGQRPIHSLLSLVRLVFASLAT
jgi:hypothetical protein